MAPGEPCGRLNDSQIARGELTAAIKVVVSRRAREQSHRDRMRRRARTLAAAQMDLLVAMRRQERSESMRVGFGIGMAFRAACGARAGDQTREWLARARRQVQGAQALQGLIGFLRSRDAR